LKNHCIVLRQTIAGPAGKLTRPVKHLNCNAQANFLNFTDQAAFESSVAAVPSAFLVSSHGLNLKPNSHRYHLTMKTDLMLKIVVLCGFLGSGVASAAPQAKSYQVTGPVMEVTDKAITVKKGEDNWQIARDAGTKIDGDLKVGAKVTIHYRMVATDVEVKGDKTDTTKAKK
jgi:hypothetical protein